MPGSRPPSTRLVFLAFEKTWNDVFMEIIALIISGLSLIVAGVGTHQSNKRSKEALAESHKATADARWFSLQEAVQRLIGFDPNAEPVGERLNNLRISMIALVDQLEDWDGLDQWLDAERMLGAVVSRQVLEVSTSSDGVEERVANVEPLMAWAQALSQNLRYLRSTGHDRKKLSTLQANAAKKVEEVCSRHSWQLPPAENPRLGPLE